jgi:hypothetical protein
MTGKNRIMIARQRLSPIWLVEGLDQDEEPVRARGEARGGRGVGSLKNMERRMLRPELGAPRMS